MLWAYMTYRHLRIALEVGEGRGIRPSDEYDARHYAAAAVYGADMKAKSIAAYFSEHNRFRTHSRRFGLREIDENKIPLNRVDLGKEPSLHRLILRLYAAISHTFSRTGVFKMYENSQGQALCKMIQPVMISTAPGLPAAITKGGKKK
jgi:hypothetical protein